MSYTEEDAGWDSHYEELGPQWAQDHEFWPYEDAIKEFTAERLRSYYVSHPNVAEPANSALVYAQSLMPSHSTAALVFAVTATELAVKIVLLKPIVFGLVHTEKLASFITDLVIQHNGMERFQTLLTEILSQFGGVDLKIFKRTDSAKTLWNEMAEVRKVRNTAIHGGEAVPPAAANLALAVATTLLKELFPQVLAKLDLHLHEPGVICSKVHGVTAQVHFHRLPQHLPSISGSAEFDTDCSDLRNMPETITGKLKSDFSNEAMAALHAEGQILKMWITSTLTRMTFS